MLADVWWSTDYADDIVEAMKKKEKEIPPFFGQSPQLECRQYLAQLIKQVVKKFHLPSTCLHLTMHLLDYFMDQHHIDKDKLKLLAMGSVLLAAKFDAVDSQVPHVSELNKCLSEPYLIARFCQMELVLLRFYNWKLMIPTAAHFIDYFGTKCWLSTDMQNGESLHLNHKLLPKIHQFIKYFLDVSIQDIKFLNFPRSVVAAACIACTRLSLMIVPTWPSELQKITTYTLDPLQPCVQLMLRALKADEVIEKGPVEKLMDSDKDDSSSTIESSLQDSSSESLKDVT